MNQKRKLLTKSTCVSFIAIIFILSSMSFGVVAKKAITSIQSMSLEAPHLQTYNLPTTVVATFSDKSKQSVPVQWTPKKADTSQLGTKTYTGTVKGTKAVAHLTLKVVPSIVSIPDTLSQYSVNSEAILPSTVKVVLSNKAIENRPVKWNQTVVKTSELGLIEITGSVEGTNIAPKHTSKIISEYLTVADLNVKVKVKDVYTLPKEVAATAADGSLYNTPIKWMIENTQLDTSKATTLTIEGQARGYEKTVKAVIAIEPVIEKVEDIVIELTSTDNYSIPNEVKVTMNDGTTKNVAITWTKPLPNLKIVGNYEVLGTLVGYDKPVKYTYVVKASPFSVTAKFVETNQGGFFEIELSKPLLANVDLSKIILVNGNWVQNPIKILNFSSSKSKKLMIMPIVKLQSGVTYALIIPAKTLKSIDGDSNPDDLNYVVTIK